MRSAECGVQRGAAEEQWTSATDAAREARDGDGGGGGDGLLQQNARHSAADERGAPGEVEGAGRRRVQQNVRRDRQRHKNGRALYDANVLKEERARSESARVA